MAESLGQVTSATSELGQTLENIKRATTDTSAASENVAEEAQSMSEGVTRLEQLLDQFQYDDKEQETRNRAALPAKAKKVAKK